MRRKLCVIAAAALLVGSLAGCSGGSDNGKTATGAAETTAAETKAEETKGEDAASKEETEAAKKEASGELKKIVVGASPAPHAEILKAAQEVLAEKGYELDIKEYVDYIQPNLWNPGIWTPTISSIFPIWNPLMKRTKPSWCPQEPFTMNPLASTQERLHPWRSLPTEPEWQCPMIPAMRQGPFFFWRLRA